MRLRQQGSKAGWRDWLSIDTGMIVVLFICIMYITLVFGLLFYVKNEWCDLLFKNMTVSEGNFITPNANMTKSHSASGWWCHKYRVTGIQFTSIKSNTQTPALSPYHHMFNLKFNLKLLIVTEVSLHCTGNKQVDITRWLIFRFFIGDLASSEKILTWVLSNNVFRE